MIEVMPLLSVKNLEVSFTADSGTVKAVRNISFSINRGETLAVVGESGCGKSVTVQSVMGLLSSPPANISASEIKLKDQNILSSTRINGKDIRGNEIGMIFQDPMTSLNPTMKIGNQVAETLIVHRGLSRKAAQLRAIELLDLVKIPEPAKRARQYPFEFSGGMLQRAMIAMSIACEPKLLIADEPTTALDVTIQAEILELLKDLQASNGMSIILITHDLAVVAKMADRVLVMYAGKIVEEGSCDDIFYRSAHPYTIGLKSAMPRNQRGTHIDLLPIDGSPPDLYNPPEGCGYAERCSHSMEICLSDQPNRFPIMDDHQSECWLHHSDNPQKIDGMFYSTSKNDQ